MDYITGRGYAWRHSLPHGAFGQSPGQAPAVVAPKSARPVVISSANGNVYKNGGDVTCVQKAFTLMTQGSAATPPILGAGLYVDGAVGAAGSTGRGEANLYNLSSYLIVEALRRGAHPKDAGMEALRRVVANTVEKRLLNDRRQPNFGLNFYVLNARGEHAGVSMYPYTYAVCDEKGPRTLPTEALFEGEP